MDRNDIRSIMNDLAFEISEHGTARHARSLEILADLTRSVAPGASDALVDWTGTEVARQRAFAMVHRAVNYQLNSDERADVVLRLTPLASLQLVA